MIDSFPIFKGPFAKGTFVKNFQGKVFVEFVEPWWSLAPWGATQDITLPEN